MGDSWSGNSEVMGGTNTHTHTALTEPMELSKY